MNVELYNVSDPPNKVKKTLKGKKTIENVIFKDDNSLDILNPTIVIRLTTEITDYTKYNYCRIGKFARYYYISSISTKGGLVELRCKVDPLMSFSGDIIGSLQYVSRSENLENRYLVDSLLPISSKHLFTIQPFGLKAYDENCINVILETAGKGGAL